MGFETGENLFLSGAGWREPVIPMMMRKGPFYIASEGSTAGTFQSVIAMDQSHPKVKNNTGEPLFLEHGGHSPYLEKIVQVLERIEASHPHTLAFAKTLNEMSLITPIDLKVTDKEGAPHNSPVFLVLTKRECWHCLVKRIPVKRSRISCTALHGNSVSITAVSPPSVKKRLNRHNNERPP